MDRFLLFDSGCSACSSLAQQVEQMSGNLLQIRSLRDPEIQQQLNEASPGWKWEPMLMEREAGAVRVFRGLAFRTRLLRGLGLARTWHIAQLLYRTSAATKASSARRNFFRKGAAALTGSLAFSLGAGSLFSDRAQAASVAGGETSTLITTVASEDAIINHLKSSLAVQHASARPSVKEGASSSAGQLDWSRVYRCLNAEKKQAAYMVLYTPTSPESPLKFLMIGDPSTQQDHFGLIGEGLLHQGQQAYTWFTLDGQEIGTVTSSGQVTPASVPAVSPDIRIGCFLLCIGRTVATSCIGFCVCCASEPFLNPCCVVCTGCAGLAGILCATSC